MVNKELPISKKLKLSAHPLFSSEKFAPNFQKIHKTHSEYREIQKDGNCLYTSLIHQFLEHLITLPAPKYDTLIRTFEHTNSNLQKAGISEIAFIDFYKTFCEAMTAVRSQEALTDELDQQCYNEIIAYFKLIISTEMKGNKNKYEAFISGMGVEEYCRKKVDVFYVEAGHLEIEALVSVLGVGVRVVSGEDGNVYKFGNEEEYLSILYTPNHFEPLYENKI